MVVCRQDPGSRLVKLNGPHGRVLDSLATCECTHSRGRHKKTGCECGCLKFKEASRMAFVMYDFRHTSRHGPRNQGCL